MLEIKSSVHCDEPVNDIAIVAKCCSVGGLMKHLSSQNDGDVL